ncbi:MAG: hypothetical protein N2321_08175 [Melioribacteraceae bacterium]|nr:hypothetical protein [Melioribacteraceae bacterium]
MKKYLSVTLLFVITFILLTENVFAIPAFARKYNMSCQTCHSPFPKLKPYGDEFAGNGFVLADKDAPRYFVDTGDDQLSLIRDLPIALRLEGFVTYNNKNSEKLDFTSPYLLKFLSGGALAKNISYYFYFFFSERGEVAGIEDAFIMFNDLFEQDLDLYIGQFQVSDPLFKRELRLTFDDYQLYNIQPGFSKANLTYDRGIMLTYGLPSKTDIVIEILNGTGIGAPDNFRNFDDDKYKNFFGRISQDISDDFRIGAFGYFGKEKLETNTTFINSFTMFGPDLTFKFKDQLEFNFQYGNRIDDNAFGNKKEINTKGGFGELIYTPKGDESKWYAVALYNWIDSDFDGYDYQTGSLHLGYLLRRNLRLISELSYDFKNKFSQFTLGFVSAF